MKNLLLTLGTALTLATPLQAALFSYHIEGVVTSAPNVPNIFTLVGDPNAPNWTFPTLPAPFAGTFTADDSSVGPITDFALEVGGVDIASTHPMLPFSAPPGSPPINWFDPASLTLIWAGVDPDQDTTFVSIGNTTNTPGYPHNRIVATQFTDPNAFPPGDPIFLTTINWEGTFAIKQGARVPESSSTLFGASLGFGILLTLSFLRSKRQSPKA